MAEELKSISTFYAGNGRPFDLLATDDLKQFYIDLEQLAASTDDYHGLPIGTTSAEALAHQFGRFFATKINGENKFLMSVESYELRLSKNFPTEIFEAVKRPFPAPVKVLETSPILIHSTGLKNLPKQILIYENADEYLIDLGNINYLLTGSCDWSPALIKAVLRDYKVYTWRHSRYFCSLDAVPDIFTDIGTKEARKLARRFERQVFMTPTSCKINFVKLKCKLFQTEPWEGGEFKIYRGVGFAQNGFFFKSDELATLLAGDDCGREDALDMAAHELGEFRDKKDYQFYCRLDYTDSIVRNYLAKLWNGENEHNKFIQRGWSFIRWFHDFLPKFFKQHGIDFDTFFGQFHAANAYEEETESNPLKDFPTEITATDF
ncbi:MAG: hypothetical protein IJG80_09385 [Selenomonadaceae bacterium]|nr:hypothetical protein [Selenomonadaceae bacterium]MBQ3433714.1 hypothetical protein [Selenomonadaceae bacterium]